VTSRFQKAMFSLILIGLIAGVLWRLEVEWHGWEGLVWTTYFHWAYPAGVLLFVAWLSAFCGVAGLKFRIAFILILFFYFAAVYPIVENSAKELFYRNIFMGSPSWWDRRFSIFIIFPLVFWIFLCIARIFKAPMSLKGSILSFGLYLLSFPIAELLLALFHHRGGADTLHAIKSGFVIPLMVLSFGFPFVLGAAKKSIKAPLG